MKKGEQELHDFITKNHPGYEGVLLCKAKRINDLGTEISEYYCIVKHQGGSGPIYTINDRFWYDYVFKWENGDPNWEIIFKQE